jgi:hypothetical protein
MDHETRLTVEQTFRRWVDSRVEITTGRAKDAEGRTRTSVTMTDIRSGTMRSGLTSDAESVAILKDRLLRELYAEAGP